ncbi:hypothetical protein [Vallitalea okinawensis]|uniref:hypothetical protein n=1 Tax=Vallitalea okinawensis TaxID=2078660 RepID=UPI000CFCB90D|nr:hypothetical protein [Vallitalea okinawensis]
MSQQTKSSLDLDKELFELGKKQVHRPTDLSTETFEKMKIEQDEKDVQAMSWILGFALAANVMFTLIAICFIGLSLYFNNHYWLILIPMSFTIQVSLVVISLVFKEPIVKGLSKFLKVM